jgi:phospholipid/cholesterol/gamma-HCH transport system substrate-binding protein
MNAAKENFLFRGYYRRKEKAAEKIKNDSIEKKSEDLKIKEKEKDKEKKKK